MGMEQMGMGAPMEGNDIGARMRELARSKQPSMDMSGEFPSFGQQGA
jgi:hypothetical protein